MFKKERLTTSKVVKDMISFTRETIKDMMIAQTEAIGMDPEALRIAASGIERLNKVETIMENYARMEDERDKILNDKLDKIMEKLEIM